MMMNSYKINWTEINDIVYRVLNFLGDKHSQDIHSFLDWYDQIDQSNVTMADSANTSFKNWVLSGIIPMKKIISLMNDEIKQFEKSITNIFNMKKGLPDKIKLSDRYYKAIAAIHESIVEFLGCRNKFGEWYVNFLKMFPNEPKVKNNLDFFEMTCITSRGRVLYETK